MCDVGAVMFHIYIVVIENIDGFGGQIMYPLRKALDLKNKLICIDILYAFLLENTKV